MIPEESAATENSNDVQPKPKKAPKRGIIYLSCIPPYMNVTKIREFFNEFGTVGRVYLQLADIGNYIKLLLLV